MNLSHLFSLGRPAFIQSIYSDRVQEHLCRSENAPPSQSNEVWRINRECDALSGRRGGEIIQIWIIALIGHLFVFVKEEMENGKQE